MYLKKAALRSVCIVALLMFAVNGLHARRQQPITDTAAGAIAGTITNKSGTRLINAKLELITGDHVVKTIHTDSEGFYAFKQLQAGLYQVKVLADEYKQTISEPVFVDKDHNLQLCNLCILAEYPRTYKLSYKYDIKCADTPLTMQVDSILVLKSKRELLVFNSKVLLKVYHASLGQIPVGPKQFKGDLKTPEGLYHINGRNAKSEAHKNLGISYPNDAQRAYAKKMGRPTGGDVKIHGALNGFNGDKTDYQGSDWTWGCIAVLDEEIDELFTHVPIGTPINILP